MWDSWDEERDLKYDWADHWSIVTERSASQGIQAKSVDRECTRSCREADRVDPRPSPIIAGSQSI